jgi:hypothetical protein
LRVTAFDQPTWEATTAWSGASPSARAVLGHLESIGSPHFQESLQLKVANCDLLLAGQVQALAAEFGPGDIESVRLQVLALTGRRVRPSTVRRLLQLEAEANAQWDNRFANLVSGRFTELLFEYAYRPPLEAVGLRLDDATTDRSFLDYVIRGPDGFELSVNVKNAGVQMREAQRFYGLDPDDTLPMASYKTFGVEQAAIPPLIYVYLVDWRLLPVLRSAYWQRLDTAEQTVFRLMTSFKGLPRDLQDAFINATVADRIDDLREAVGSSDAPHDRFRVVSAARCAQIFYSDHDRSRTSTAGR